jgi:hypothetical protein
VPGAAQAVAAATHNTSAAADFKKGFIVCLLHLTAKLYGVPPTGASTRSHKHAGQR